MLEDFSAQKGWISPLLITLNSFMEATVTALTNEITVAANTTGDIKQITISAQPTADAPVSVAWRKKNNPIAVLVGNVALTTGADFTLGSAVQVQWRMSGDSLQITNVVGITLSGTNQYVLTLLCIAG